MNKQQKELKEQVRIEATKLQREGETTDQRPRLQIDPLEARTTPAYFYFR